MTEFVKTEILGPVAVLHIDRPKALNALNHEIVSDIADFAERMEKDENVRVLMIYNEKNFAAGADIKVMAECDPESIREFSFVSQLQRLENVGIPTIAVMEGYALGGGMELALACDFRFAAEDAQIGFPEITLGVIPGACGNVRMTRLIGAAAAKELIFTGARIDAKRAYELGAVNRVLPKEQLFAAAMEFAEKLAKRPPLAMAAAKRVINYSVNEPNIESAASYEQDNFAALFATHDQKEGMRAFIEKRKPEFTGK